MATTTTAAAATASHPSSSNDVSSSSTTMIVSTGEAMNPKRRSNMEDCHVVHAPGTWGAPDPDMAYLGVYDGHGGRDMVDYLEHFLAFHVAEELKHDEDTTVELKLERAFLTADIHATQCGVQTSGATVICCLVQKLQNQQLIIHSANVGDARAVLGTNKGTTNRLSQDHRVDDAEAERIDKAGGFVFKGRVLGILAVTRSLGDFGLKDFVIAKPYYRQINIDMEDEPTVLILACDGLWDVMEDQEAIQLAINFDGDKEQVAQYLVDEAIRRGSGDNVTVVVAWL